MPLRTIFLQEMCERGILIPYSAISWSHSDKEIDLALEAARASLSVYARAVEDGAEKYLRGPAVKPVFRRFNKS